MPWIVEGDCVKIKATGKTVKCYSGEGAHEKAVKYAAALNINAHKGAVTDAPSSAKRNKDDRDVNYIEDSGGVQPCDHCRYFENGTCTIVEGLIAPNGHCDLYEPMLSEGSISTMQMAIAKASLDEATGEMRWSATASDTAIDNWNTRMTQSLFRSFIRRIETKEPVPEPFQTMFFKGGMPYLSVSHYPDFNGLGHVGMARAVYIDGDRLKSKGIFQNELRPQRALRAFEAVRADIKDNVPFDKRIRISISFLDYQHKHADGTIFVRANLTDMCPICAKGEMPTEFLDGHLMHEALTRVPVNPRTPIVAFSEAYMITMKQDAASIVGDEDAEELELLRKGQKPTSLSLTNMSQGDGTIPIVRAYGGALTISAALEWVKVAERERQMYDLWYMLSAVMDNILYDMSLVAISDKAAAMLTAITDFQTNVDALAKVALAQLQVTLSQPLQETPMEPTTTPAPVPTPAPAPIPAPQVIQPVMPVLEHPLDVHFAEIRAAYDKVRINPTLSRADKLTVLQEPLNKLGAAMRSAVDGSPATATDIEGAVERVLSRMLAPMLAQNQSGAASGGAPQMRQLVPQMAQPIVQPPTIQPTAQSVAPTNALRAAVRRSVGLKN